MKVEWRPIVHFTKKEAKKVEEARLILYKTSNRGPWFGNPSPGSMCWNLKTSATYWELVYTESALRFEFQQWSKVKEIDQSQQRIARFGREPTPSEVMTKLVSAIVIIEKALKLCSEKREVKVV